MWTILGVGVWIVLSQYHTYGTCQKYEREKGTWIMHTNKCNYKMERVLDDFKENTLKIFLLRFPFARQWTFRSFILHSAPLPLLFKFDENPFPLLAVRSSKQRINQDKIGNFIKLHDGKASHTTHRRYCIHAIDTNGEYTIDNTHTHSQRVLGRVRASLYSHGIA